MNNNEIENKINQVVNTKAMEFQTICNSLEQTVNIALKNNEKRDKDNDKILDKLDSLKDDIGEVKIQTTKTNGRVNRHAEQINGDEGIIKSIKLIEDKRSTDRNWILLGLVSFILSLVAFIGNSIWAKVIK